MGSTPAGEHDGKKMTDTDCTNVCIKKGAKYVFVSDGKVYALENQSSKTIAAHAGHQVELTGTLKGDTINATKITHAGGQIRKRLGSLRRPQPFCRFQFPVFSKYELPCPFAAARPVTCDAMTGES